MKLLTVILSWLYTFIEYAVATIALILMAMGMVVLMAWAGGIAVKFIKLLFQ